MTWIARAAWKGAQGPKLCAPSAVWREGRCVEAREGKNANVENAGEKARGVPASSSDFAAFRTHAEESQAEFQPWRKNLVVLTISLFFVAVGFSQLIPFLPLFLTSDLGLRNSPTSTSGPERSTA